MPSTSDPPPLPPDHERSWFVGRVRAYSELLRIPNVFTAASNVTMGYLVADPLTAKVSNPSATPPFGLQFALLLGASCCLYMAGMALNDVFDASTDATERPERPIPSGRVSFAAARLMGWELLIGGAACAWLASFFADRWWPGIVGSLLAGSVLLYDGVAKRTPFGPLVMAACRGLNVLLGMSLVASIATGLSLPWETPHCLIAAGIAVYTFGITLMARDEAFGGSRVFLAAGTIILLGGMAILISLPMATPAMMPNTSRWWLLWGVLIALIGWRCVVAMIDPRPALIRAAVKHAILSIIFLDAAVTAGVCGSALGIVVLAFFVPAMILGKWFEST